LTNFFGVKNRPKIEIFKTYPIAKIIIKIAFYALKNPYKHVFAKQKAPEDPKIATPNAELVSYIYRIIVGTHLKN